MWKGNFKPIDTMCEWECVHLEHIHFLELLGDE